jgi:aminodeoxyfutalosine deaminase
MGRDEDGAAHRIARWSKVELHVHLEGTIRPETLLRLSKVDGRGPRFADVDAARRWMRPHDFEDFLEIYSAIKGHLRTADDYALVVGELGDRLARDNVRYAEVTFTPSTHLRNGVRPEVFLDGLARGRDLVARSTGITLAWIFDIARRRRDGWRAMADSVTELAIAERGRGVVALGLGGAEATNPPEAFAPWFARAKADGLRSVPHAGETAGPASIRAALTTLAADRIGHGVRAIEDEALLDELGSSQTPLEINVTSNLALGVYASLGEHPVRRLLDRGLNVTVSTDIPAVVDTTLNREFTLLHEAFGLDLPALDRVRRAAAHAAFVSPEVRAALLAEMDADHLTR